MTKLMKKPRLCLVVAALLMTACGNKENTTQNVAVVTPIDPGPYGDAATATNKVLFIGNSLTYFNDQPGTFWNLAATSGLKTYVEQATIPGAQLEDHLNSAFTMQKIQRYAWDVVVLQVVNTDMAFVASHGVVTVTLQVFLNKIREQNTKVRLFCFLPFAGPDGISDDQYSYDYEQGQTMFRDGTLTVAKKLDLMVAPVGWAWRSVRQNRPDINLYAADQIHPSAAGSYLGACVYVVSIAQKKLESNAYIASLAPDIANFLQQTASQTVLDSLSYWNIKP
jgi:hypothetical protein